MSIGIGQILIILLLGSLLFGNAPKLIKDLASGVGAGITEVRNAIAEKPPLASKETEASSNLATGKLARYKNWRRTR